MRAREFISEIGTKPVKYHWEKFLGTDRAVFTVGEYHYVYDAFVLKPGEYKIRFCQLQSSGDCEHGITDTGHAFEVMATVDSITKEFIHHSDPKIIRFSADEPSRRKLYSRILKKYSNDWDVSEDRGFFTMVRKSIKNTSKPNN